MKPKNTKFQKIIAFLLMQTFLIITCLPVPGYAGKNTQEKKVNQVNLDNLSPVLGLNSETITNVFKQISLEQRDKTKDIITKGALRPLFLREDNLLIYDKASKQAMLGFFLGKGVVLLRKISLKYYKPAVRRIDGCALITLKTEKGIGLIHFFPDNTFKRVNHVIKALVKELKQQINADSHAKVEIIFSKLTFENNDVSYAPFEQTLIQGFKRELGIKDIKIIIEDGIIGNLEFDMEQEKWDYGIAEIKVKQKKFFYNRNLLIKLKAILKIINDIYEKIVYFPALFIRSKDEKRSSALKPLLLVTKGSYDEPSIRRSYSDLNNITFRGKIDEVILQFAKKYPGRKNKINILLIGGGRLQDEQLKVHIEADLKIPKNKVNVFSYANENLALMRDKNQLTIGDIDNGLPYNSDFFHLAIVSDVVAPYFKNKFAALRQIQRTLTNDGKAFVADFGLFSFVDKRGKFHNLNLLMFKTISQNKYERDDGKDSVILRNIIFGKTPRIPEFKLKEPIPFKFGKALKYESRYEWNQTLADLLDKISSQNRFFSFFTFSISIFSFSFWGKEININIPAGYIYTGLGFFIAALAFKFLPKIIIGINSIKNSFNPQRREMLEKIFNPYLLLGIMLIPFISLKGDSNLQHTTRSLVVTLLLKIALTRETSDDVFERDKLIINLTYTQAWLVFDEINNKEIAGIACDIYTKAANAVLTVRDGYYPETDFYDYQLFRVIAAKINGEDWVSLMQEFADENNKNKKRPMQNEDAQDGDTGIIIAAGIGWNNNGKIPLNAYKRKVQPISKYPVLKEYFDENSQTVQNSVPEGREKPEKLQANLPYIVNISKAGKALLQTIEKHSLIEQSI
ncbi:MAG: hypothetical protein ABIG64_02970 [Candidatus Omnitrophota bacterium]